MTTINELQSQLTGLPDERDIPNTMRAQEELATKRQQLLYRIGFARGATDRINEIKPQLVNLEKWRDHLLEWRKFCQAQLLASQPERNRATMDIITGLKQSLTAIDFGFDWQNTAVPANMPLFKLMKDAGYGNDEFGGVYNGAWQGSLPVTEERITDLEKRLAQAHLDLQAVLL